MVTVCCEYSPSEPPASLPVIVPVTGSTEAMLGSLEVQVMSFVIAATGFVSVISS